VQGVPPTSSQFNFGSPFAGCCPGYCTGGHRAPGDRGVDLAEVFCRRGVIAGRLICRAAFGSGPVVLYVDDRAGVTVLGNLGVRLICQAVAMRCCDPTDVFRGNPPHLPPKNFKAKRRKRGNNASGRGQRANRITNLIAFVIGQADLDRVMPVNLAQIESLIPAARSEIDGVQRSARGLREARRSGTLCRERAGREIDPQTSAAPWPIADAETKRLERAIEASRRKIKEVAATLSHQRARLVTVGCSEGGSSMQPAFVSPVCGVSGS